MASPKLTERLSAMGLWDAEKQRRLDINTLYENIQDLERQRRINAPLSPLEKLWGLQDNHRSPQQRETHIRNIYRRIRRL